MTTPSSTPNKEGVSRVKHFMAGLVDLIFIPVFFGAFIGLFTFWVLGSGSLSFIFYLAYIVWVIFRDVAFSPGRALFDLSLVSLEGGEVTIPQAIKRNLLILIPFIGLIGYLIEAISLVLTGERVLEGWAKTKVVESNK